MVQPGFKPGTSCSADHCFPNWANQAAVNLKHIFFLPKTNDEQLNSDKCGLAMGVLV